MIEIADKAYSDTMIVVFVSDISGDTAVCTMFLLGPAGTDLDLADRRVGTVADDEMVAKFVHALLLDVGLVESDGTAGSSSAVVDDDVVPAVGKIGDTPWSAKTGSAGVN